jgi:hypothetical protein
MTKSYSGITFGDKLDIADLVNVGVGGERKESGAVGEGMAEKSDSFTSF